MAEFHLGELGVMLSQQQLLRERDLIELRVDGLEVPSFVKRTYDTKLNFSLRGIHVLDHMGKDAVHLVESNPRQDLMGISAAALLGQDVERLIEVGVVMYDDESPSLQVCAHACKYACAWPCWSPWVVCRLSATRAHTPG